jgi:hypothetical protein
MLSVKLLEGVCVDMFADENGCQRRKAVHDSSPHPVVPPKITFGDTLHPRYHVPVLTTNHLEHTQKNRRRQTEIKSNVFRILQYCGFLSACTIFVYAAGD